MLIIKSVGQNTDPRTLGTLPDNIKAYSSVDQIEVLQSAEVFPKCGGYKLAADKIEALARL